MGGKTIREPGAGWGNVYGAGSKGINLGSREPRKKSREQSRIIKEQVKNS